MGGFYYIFQYLQPTQKQNRFSWFFAVVLFGVFIFVTVFKESLNYLPCCRSLEVTLVIEKEID